MASSKADGWQARREILRAAALETTAHGLSRTVGDRHWLLRLLWMVAFLVVVGVLLKQLVDAVRKLQEMPVSTSVEPNNVDFVFPDIHVCSYPMVSASYSATLGAAQLSYVEQQMSKIVKLLQLAGVKSSDELTRLASLAFIGTLPYSFLSSSFGMRMEQTFIGATVMPVTVNLLLNVDIINLRHYKFLNCFTLRINDTATRSLLNNVMNYLELSLYADATYNRTLRLNNDTIDSRGLSFVNYEYLIGSGFRIYFTERGKYPDDYSASVTVSPGFQHHISLSMSKTSLAIDKQQCVSNKPEEKIFDPASEKSVGYAYSLGSCYANSLYNAFRKLNCYIPGYFPIPYSQRDLRSCNNLTELVAAFNGSSVSPDKTGMLPTMRMVYNGSIAVGMVESMRTMQTDCAYQKPCEEINYQPTVTSILFPMRQGLTAELTNIFKALTQARASSGYFVPGRDWMVGMFDAAFVNGTKNSTAEDALATAAAENIVRIQIQAGELSSTQLSQAISYKIDDLTAGVGGLMGLFMGGSMLTLLELVELCAFLIWGRRIIAVAAVEPGETATASATSADAGQFGKTLF